MRGYRAVPCSNGAMLLHVTRDLMEDSAVPRGAHRALARAVRAMCEKSAVCHQR